MPVPLKKLLIVNPELPSDSIELPYLYMALRSYYQENGKSVQNWKWLEPVGDVSLYRFEELVKHILSLSPDIVGFSCFVWNSELNFQLANAIKTEMPSIKTVFGGPNISIKHDSNWFNQNMFVDLVCHYPGRGEEFFTTLLDQIGDGVYEPQNIPFAIYPENLTRKLVVSQASQALPPFVWPKSIFQGSEDAIFYSLSINKRESRNITMVWETTRGCPYQCSYCEWGGGTNTKIIKKPDEVISNELMYIDFLRVNTLMIVDANFGIFSERDISIVKKIVEISKKGNLKQVYLFGKSKNNKDANEIIDAMLLEAGLTDRETFNIAINASNENILAAVKRKNLPHEMLVEFGKKFKAQYKVNLKFELILGLPESTLDSFYLESCLFDDVDDWTTERYPWALLPSTPAADPEYIRKYNIKVSHVRYDSGTDITAQVYSKNQTHLLTDSAYQSRYPIVVSTSSYSEGDWLQMFIIDHFARAMELSGFLTDLRKSLQTKLKIAAGDFYRHVWQSFDRLPDKSKLAIEDIKFQLNSILSGENINKFKYFENPFVPDKLLKLETYFNLFYFYYCKEFLGALITFFPEDCRYLFEKTVTSHSHVFSIKTELELFNLAKIPYLNKTKEFDSDSGFLSLNR
jgi:putative methyltransferase